jgi:hypothetical protein
VLHLDFHVIIEFSELPHCELGLIISNDIIRDTELVHDISWFCFDPLGKLVYCHEDVCETTFSLFEWTYQVLPPC